MHMKLLSLFNWIKHQFPFCWSFRMFNYCGALYTSLLIILLVIINAHYCCPSLYGYESCQLPVFLAYVLLWEILANILLFHWFSKTNSVKYWLSGQLQNNPSCLFTKFCYSCQETVPTHSHHCPVCGICVLRKDHHCFLVGGCVGFGTQRYFVVFLFWAAVGGAYGTLYLLRYLDSFFQPFFPFGWVDYLAPLALRKWMFTQHCSLSNLFMCILFSSGMACTIGAACFFLAQIFFISKGTTMYDYRKRDLPFEPGSFNQHLVSLFGPYWALNFICPQPWFRSRLSSKFRRNLDSCCTKDL